jgi:hypothetical protein
MRTTDSASGAFRAAFERLTEGRPEALPRGTPVTQNNVAREAGRDPTALKKSRYPELIAEIQQWRTQHDPVAPQKDQPRRVRVRPSRDEVVRELIAERDLLASKLLEAETYIIELSEKAQLGGGASNVVPIR